MNITRLLVFSLLFCGRHDVSASGLLNPTPQLTDTKSLKQRNIQNNSFQSARGVHELAFYRKQHRDHRVRSSVLSLRGGAVPVEGLITSTYDWSVNLGAPAALVAGAVIATIFEKKNDNSLATKKTDAKWVIFARRTTGFLLMSAFTCEIISIFVTTVTGTMLMSAADRSMEGIDVSMNSGLGFLKANFEFEYLTSRITFLQGLLNWLAAIALDFLIPVKGESSASRKMNLATAGFLTSTILLMVSFYNGHMSFYTNYYQMLARWTTVSWKRYIWNWPMRPMSVLIIPSLLFTIHAGFGAFFAPAEDD